MRRIVSVRVQGKAEELPRELGERLAEVLEESSRRLAAGVYRITLETVDDEEDEP